VVDVDPKDLAIAISFINGRTAPRAAGNHCPPI
jgi:hypothetical protein